MSEVDAEKWVECVLQWAKENPICCDLPTRILVDAEALKAADELAEVAQVLVNRWNGIDDDLQQAITAYRKARGTA